jgi:hypothetical protein
MTLSGTIDTLECAESAQRSSTYVVWLPKTAMSERSLLARLTFTYWRAFQSTSWFSSRKFVFSPSRFTRYLMSTWVAGHESTTSGVRDS